MLDDLKLQLVDYFRKTDGLKEFRSFLSSQWNSLEHNQDLQWNKLIQLLHHAYNHVPYYRKLFDSSHIKPESIKTKADFEKIPILTKDIIRANYSDMFSDNRELFQPRMKRTGGSTGTPLVYSIDRKAHSAAWAFIYRSWNVGGWEPGNRVVFIGGESIVPSFNKIKKKLYTQLNNWLFLSSFDISNESMAGWVKRIKRFDARYIYAYASSVYLFARYLESTGQSLPGFKAIYTTAEVLQDKFRQTIERVFECRVFDTYGGVDGAGFAFECEKHDGLHVVTENSYLEIVNENGHVVEDGQKGEVVSTDLYTYSMPLIRYRVGDRAALDSTPCACKRGLPRINNISGRTCDFVIDAKGTQIHGEYFSHLFNEFSWIKQFFVHQKSREEICISIIADGQVIKDELKNIQSLLEKKFDDMNIDIQFTETIPQTKHNKFKFIVNDVV